jgi:hypothetical protein
MFPIGTGLANSDVIPVSDTVPLKVAAPVTVIRANAPMLVQNQIAMIRRTFHIALPPSLLTNAYGPILVHRATSACRILASAYRAISCQNR